jgi:hypothetical protein
MSVRVNGTYHAPTAQRQAQRRTRLLIGIGGLVALVSLVQIVLLNRDMTGIEQSGPERLALAGGGIDRFVPSLLANFSRAQAPLNTGAGFLANDPRHSVPYVEDKRALERWTALAGFGLSALFIGLESTIPHSGTTSRSPTGTDLSRLLILLSLTYAALSIFESG